MWAAYGRIRPKSQWGTNRECPSGDFNGFPAILVDRRLEYSAAPSKLHLATRNIALERSGIVLNPIDWTRIELTKDKNLDLQANLTMAGAATRATARPPKKPRRDRSITVPSPSRTRW